VKGAEAELTARPASVQRAASLALGSGLLRAAAGIAGEGEEEEQVRWMRRALGELTPRASVYGAVAAAFDATAEQAARAYVYTVLAGMAAAAVRLGRAGPFEGQAALRAALAAERAGDGLADRLADDAPANEWALFSPLLDVAAMRHELLEPRLFAS
jgi:urease accessory protein UreF